MKRIHRALTGALVAAAILAATGCSAPDTTPTQTAPTLGPVLKVGALDGAAGEALTWLRSQDSTGLDLQWLQFTDAASMVDNLALGGADAIVVSESQPLTGPTEANAKFVSVGAVWTEAINGVSEPQVLVTTNELASDPRVKEILKDLQAKSTIEHLQQAGKAVTPTS